MQMTQSIGLTSAALETSEEPTPAAARAPASGTGVVFASAPVPP